MINASKSKLSSFFQGNIQYEVPFFQRPYVWDRENWQNFWEHISTIAENPLGKQKEHFIGTIITKQQLAEKIGDNKYDLIDGQQRLTTISLLLKAIANTASGGEDYPKLRSNTNDLVMFEDAKGKKYLRLKHSKHDMDYFEAVMNDKDLSALPNQEHKIIRGYKFFLNNLVKKSDEERDVLRTIVLESVPVISMLLGVEDDEQEIFDTINSLGVRLTTGELLKNFIFKEKILQNSYTELWEKVFETDEESILFWEKNKTSGRIIRTNIELLLYCYLIIKTHKEVKLEKLFSEYKDWLKSKSQDEKKTFLTELKEYAGIYEGFPEGADLKEFSFSETEKRFFHTIENLEINTVYPLVLYIYRHVKEREQRDQMLELLESYLVRRAICRRTTKNYNNLFIQIIANLEEEKEVSKSSLLNILLDFSVETNLFPDDAELKSSFYNNNFSNHFSRVILFSIALKSVDNPLSDVRKLNFESFTAEHMMPVKWEENWSDPGLTEVQKMQREKWIKSLGNLTLVTGKMNRKMQNSGWMVKIDHLKHNSRLQITQRYLSRPVWNEELIQSRNKDLLDQALEIWKRN